MNDSSAYSQIARAQAGEVAIAISVVIPTYRRLSLLRRCLAAVCAQSFPAERFEVIVADDDAGPQRSAQMQEWIARYFTSGPGRPTVRHVPVTRTQGPAGARNRGWQEARGEVIAFTDDDTIPDRAWLSCGWAAMEQGWDAVSGTIRMPLSERPTDYERNAAGLSAAEFATANCFVRRAALAAIGGFDERFTAAWREDSDLQFSLLDQGLRVGHAAAAIVTHPIRPAPWGISLVQQRKVFFDALLFKKHHRRYRERIRRAPPWRYYVIVGAAMAALVGVLSHLAGLAIAAAVVWAGFTLQFCMQRLAGNSRSLSHVFEMALTSIALPPLAVFWRLRGALHYRVLFL